MLESRSEDALVKLVKTVETVETVETFFYWPSSSGQPLAPTCSYTAYTLSVNGLAYFLCCTGS